MEKEQPELKCPQCGSDKIMTERRLNGYHICTMCNHEWPNLAPRLKFSAEKEQIKIKYFDKEMPGLEPTDGLKSDWIDLRAALTVELKKGEFKLIPLGVAMQLPEGYEAHMVPRSSSFKNFKIIQTNSMGVIDNSYSGDNDQWFFPALAMEDTVINRFDRICQFRIVKKQPHIVFETVDVLNNNDRGGHGSTGVV